MKNHLNSYILSFITKNKLIDQKILIGVSCGLDSMVLLDLLLKHREKQRLEIVVAHVHHGWRKESDQEYEFLKNFCINQKIEFYAEHLNLSKDLKDAENQSRNARYEFFEKTYHRIKASILILGHHKQDLEETVIKRIHEGAHLQNLGSMTQIGLFKAMKLGRPLLDFNKNDLSAYAQVFNLTYFEDHTNYDPKFLRTRLRQDYFPVLTKVFGKNVGSSLSDLSKESVSMRDYFEKRFEHEAFISHPEARNQLFHLKGNYHLFEIQNLIIVFLKTRGLVLSKSILQSITQAFQGDPHPKNFYVKGWHLIASKGFLALFSVISDHGETKPDWIFLEKSTSSIEKLPTWFYKRVPTIKEKNKNILNCCISFRNVINYSDLIEVN